MKNKEFDAAYTQAGRACKKMFTQYREPDEVLDGVLDEVSELFDAAIIVNGNCLANLQRVINHYTLTSSDAPETKTVTLESVQRIISLAAVALSSTPEITVANSILYDIQEQRS